MKRAVDGLLLWTLLLGNRGARGEGPGGGTKRPAQQTDVTLTSERPTGYFLLDPEMFASAPPVLAVRITRILNPSKIPLQVFVYLSYQTKAGGKRGTEPEKILIGNFDLYPADRPARFLLCASTAFRKLKTTSPKPTDVQLLLQMKRLHETRTRTPVEVTLAPPEWRSEEGQ